MKRALAMAFVILCESATAASSGEQLELLGRFDNVGTGEGEHCDGHSLNLWNARGRVIGLLHRHEGLCSDPRCAVIDAPSLDAATGRLSFSARIDDETFSFRGVLKEHVTGHLNGEALRLNREPSSTGKFAPDNSVGAWCTFWKSVPRCTGVKELCAELQ
jgi:hypothetical protein